MTDTSVDQTQTTMWDETISVTSIITDKHSDTTGSVPITIEENNREIDSVHTSVGGWMIVKLWRWNNLFKIVCSKIQSLPRVKFSKDQIKFEWRKGQDLVVWYILKVRFDCENSMKILPYEIYGFYKSKYIDCEPYTME